MASVNSLSGSSSSSSIYGNRTYNIISGLASGLDTEELISGVVQSYQQKIQSLNQKNTKLQWQQEAYQSISDKLVEFYRNYSSYVYSNTNLASSSFFDKAVITTTNGLNKDLISASGKTSSDVIINAVNKLAAAAKYTASSDGLGGTSTGKVTAGDKMEYLDSNVELSNLSGSLTLNYGSRTVSIDFGERELYTKSDGSLDTEALEKAIAVKLKDQQISTSSGSVVTADTMIGVDVSADGKVSFTDKSGAGNSVSIAYASGSLADNITDLDGAIEDKSSSFQLTDAVVKDAASEKPMADYLAGQSLTFTLDGKSATIKLPEIKTGTGTANQDFVDALNTELGKAFGADSSGKNRVSASLEDGKLSFQTNEGSSLSVTASTEDVGDVLGIGSGLSTYLDTSKTLGELGFSFDGLTANSNGKYDLVINGVTIGSYDKDTEFNTIINNINSNTEAGVNVSYSQTTGQFIFTAKDTGAGGRIDIQAGGLAGKLFGATMDKNGELLPDVSDRYDKGVDAEINVTINDQNMNLTRSSNSFDLDGMQVTISGTFNESVKTEDAANKLDPADKVTFTSKTDADTIVDAVKKMVEDLNAIIKEVKSAYSDAPLKQSDNKTGYEPLTDEEKADMSETAIKNYEEKAKTGILFMDRDLSALYNDLRNAISSSGADGVTLRSMGIETSYSDGLTTLTFDEQKFRQALENDPDKVQEAFTKSKENGAATDGLMATLTSITDKYAATSGDVKGILIEKAGSKYSPTAALDNELLRQMKDVEEEITKWQDKMSNKVDYYTNKFTQLELLINQMNSQSYALAGLMGG
ncbi:flagellar filament capping protein FliD [Pseudoflavonifractor phocaeensis]|uniref:flagellar filament capping protein FliD n=1 Tax=Pseudoflavonifractor phocaeensis TaxID=1870988 RepID=UPI00195985A7|nr:flagellar filament capping protein FliD [Pseudoflavonifractor phocaeensis]MBM6887047.1 flagellar filament capping protein FliD [Pseudoflavonifractor phocaeensis]